MSITPKKNDNKSYADTDHQKKWEVQLPSSCIALKAIVDTFNYASMLLVIDQNHVIIHSKNTLGGNILIVQPLNELFTSEKLDMSIVEIFMV